MLIPAHYILTPTITQHLQTIEAARSVIDSFLLPPEVEINIRRQTLLKSSLYSARIEGNPLTLDEVTSRPSKDQKRQEVYNILKATQFIHQRGQRDVTQTVLLQTHQKTMQGLIDRKDLGKFRTDVSAIFNTAGIAIYLPPPPRQVPSLLARLLKFVNSDKEPFIPVRAVLAHYMFEKIHPFLDGNGRVGRLLLQAVLEKGGYGMKGLLSIEEQLEKHRSEYYRALEDTERDITGYVEYMLEMIAIAAEKARSQVVSKQQAEVQDYLLPRRAEIYNIIRDHRLVNFDMIRRRFMAVNERTLRYDLKQLAEAGMIRKRGTTKGVYYEVIKK